MSLAYVNREVPPQKARATVLTTMRSYLEFYFKFIQVRGEFPSSPVSLMDSLYFQVENGRCFKSSDGLDSLDPCSISLHFLFLSSSSACVITLTPAETQNSISTLKSADR